ncbi:hypothetical protein HDV00_006702 [Rhizophlyctis rosea]|nr:hypothetical protein HDV00_006702 [Rhizophlyctis rosea]
MKAAHNADYIMIGNATEASEIIVAWAPDREKFNINIVPAYAAMVKNRRVNGKDTIAVHLRQRIDAYDTAFGWGLATDAPINCTEAAPFWRCPDHILFQDTQMGVMRNALDRLLPLSELERKYFQNTGYLASLDIIPVVRAITVYEETNYAMPLALNFFTTMVNTTTLTKLNLTRRPL